jgi:hypothetical protein
VFVCLSVHPRTWHSFFDDNDECEGGEALANNNDLIIYLIVTSSFFELIVTCFNSKK